jgi:hypothetical protein
MPSQLHETLVLLFRNCPELAPILLRDSLQVEVPHYAEARIEAADLTDVQPAEYRADLVVLLYDSKPVLGIVIEVQLAPDEAKRFVWPVYTTSLRARMRCPTCVLVLTPHEHVARWASMTVELGGGNRFAPWVIGPTGVPEVLDPERAAQEPELAVLSAMAHGESADTGKALLIATAAMSASLKLDEQRSVLYFDLVYSSLSEAARQSLLRMDPAKYQFQSEFARRYLEQGRSEGETKGFAEGEFRGRSETVLKLLALRFGPLEHVVMERVRNASLAELEAWTERVLSASTLDDVLRS